MTEEQLQVIKEEYSNMDWDDFRENAGDLMDREIDIYNNVVVMGVPTLITEVERLKRIEKGMEEEIKRLRDELEVIADHNIFKVPQITVRDYARKALKTKYRTPEQNALIDKVIANLEVLEVEKP